MDQYQIEDRGDKRILVIDSNRYETNYSKKIIELIIKRKGIRRVPGYFVHKEKRSYILSPLLDYLSSHGYKKLKVLEVGCSAGQFTELLNEQPCIDEIYSFDIDDVLVEVAKIKMGELGLSKVKRIDCFSSQETTNLPYQDNFFDIVIVSAVLEHLPFENRYMYVDEYYRKLKIGGLICFLDTPNRNYPLETHSIGLPFINRLSPQSAFIYAKLFGKLKNDDFPRFVRAGTGWRNASYYEAVPQTLSIEVEDVSQELGYGYDFFMRMPHSLKFRILLKPWFVVLNYLSKKIGFPVSFFLPELNIVFKKICSFEK